MKGTRRCAMYLMLSALAAGILGAPARAEPTEGTKEAEGSKYITPEGMPTHRVTADGTVDWHTYNGFRRYHVDCHSCHGPDGEGGSFAPSLLEPLRAMSYGRFRDILASGSRDVGPTRQQVMRAMGEDPNVMCYLDDIYVYLKARSDGALGRGRPQKHEPKPQQATQNETACFGRR